MKYIFVVLLISFLAGCTFHIRAKDLDVEGRPVEPQLKMSNQTYELEAISFLKEGV